MNAVPEAQLPASHMALVSLLVTALLSMMIDASAEGMGLPVMLWMLAGFWFATGAGAALLNAARLGDIEAFAAAALLSGVLAISVMLKLLVIGFGLPIRPAALLTLGLAGAATLRRRSPGSGDAARKRTADMACLVALMPIVAAGVYKYARMPAQIVTEGRLDLWSDYFIHGVTLASLGGMQAHGGSLEFFGEGHFLYHYAGFMIPAAILSVQDLTGLAAATSVMLPLSMLCAALGAHILAAQLSGGPRSGLTAMLIALLSAALGLVYSGWFDPWWITFIAPGTGFALGASLLTIALLKRYGEQRDRRALGLIAFLILATGLSRAHFVLLLAPLAVWAVLACHQGRASTWLKGLLALLALLLLSAQLLDHPAVNTAMARLETTSYLRFCAGTLFLAGARLYPDPPVPLSWPLLLVWINLAVLGIHAIGYPLALRLIGARRRLAVIDLVPLMLLILFTGLMLFAPVAGNGDLTEYKHRHFPLLVLVFALYTSALLLNALRTRWGETGVRSGGSRTLAQILFSALLPILRPVLRPLLLPGLFLAALALAWTADPAAPDLESMPWAATLHGIRVDPELIAVAQWLRRATTPGDVFATDRKLAGSLNHSFSTGLIGLSGVPAFLSRPDLRLRGNACMQRQTRARLDTLAAIAAATDWPAARQLMNENGIRWYVSDGSPPLPWQHAAPAAFSAAALRVFDAGKPATAPAPLRCD